MEHVAVLLARLTLGVMWTTAGVAKLANPSSSRRAVETLGPVRGVPAAMAAWLLPCVELVLGVLLLVGQWIRLAGAASVVLLLALNLVMAVALLQGKRVQCNCFGQLAEAFVTWGSVWRNTALLGAALTVVLVHSDYLALYRWVRGVAGRPGEPSLADLPPLLFVWMSAVLGVMLVAALLGTGAAMARAEGGPGTDLPEAQWLRRLLGGQQQPRPQGRS
jgi:uncharacterized membrane protein YphA (DoxX/SURF4 family)